MSGTAIAIAVAMFVRAFLPTSAIAICQVAAHVARRLPIVLLALLLLLPASADPDQLMVATPRGPHMVPSHYGYRGAPPAGWLAPRGPWLNGYVRQWPPARPRYYERRGD